VSRSLHPCEASNLNALQGEGTHIASARFTHPPGHETATKA